MNDFDTFTKVPNNAGDLGKIIVATCCEWLPKVQKSAHSGHTAFYFLPKATSFSDLNKIIRASCVSDWMFIVM